MDTAPHGEDAHVTRGIGQLQHREERGFLAYVLRTAGASAPGFVSIAPDFSSKLLLWPTASRARMTLAQARAGDGLRNERLCHTHEED